MSAPPRLPVHIGDYLKNTPPIGRATWEHHGIYFVALLLAWNVPGCRLPSDPKWLAMRFGCTSEDYVQHVAPILAIYFKKRGQFLYQKRLTQEHDFVLKQSQKQRDKANTRWNKDNTECHGSTKDTPNLSRGNAPTPTPTPTPTPIQEERKNLLNAILDGKNGSGNVTIKDSAERLARFQRTLADAIPEKGWSTVIAASSPTDPNFAVALKICKETAKRLGKGWPRQWPALEVTQ